MRLTVQDIETIEWLAEELVEIAKIAFASAEEIALDGRDPPENLALVIPLVRVMVDELQMIGRNRPPRRIDA